MELTEVEEFHLCLLSPSSIWHPESCWGKPLPLPLLKRAQQLGLSDLGSCRDVADVTVSWTGIDADFFMPLEKYI